MRVKLTEDFIANNLKTPAGVRRTEFVDSDNFKGVVGMYIECRSTSPGQGTYYLRYRNANNKTCHQKIGRTTDISLDDARQRAKTLRAEITLGADPRGEEKARRAIPDFSTFFIQEYLPFAKTRKRTWAKDEEYFRLRIKDELGSVKLDRLRRKQIQDFHTSLKASGLASSTADHYLKLIKRVYSLAHSWGVIKENPASRLPLFMEDNTVENYLNNEELKRLMAVLQTDHNLTVCLIIRLLISTGVRKSEALLAQKRFINLETRVWRIPASTAKAKKMRSLPLSDAAMDVLRQAYADSGNDSEYVFVNKRTGKPYTTIQKQWERIREKAGLRHCRLHDLRHTFASYLANSGRTLLEIQTLLGHSSPKVTLRYSHLSHNTLIDASNAASAIITSAMKKTA